MTPLRSLQGEGCTSKGRCEATTPSKVRLQLAPGGLLLPCVSFLPQPGPIRSTLAIAQYVCKTGAVMMHINADLGREQVGR